MKRPTVSIVIPTYNRADTLCRAIDSVVGQSFGDWEIVVVDDGSSDATMPLLEEYHSTLGERFVSVRQKNRGCSAARNRGIEFCRGRLVAFLDSDDEFLPNKLARQLELFTACPELAFVYSDYAFVDLDGRRTESTLTDKFPLARSVPARVVGAGLYATGPELFETLLSGYFIATIVGMVRREALGVIRFDERLSYAEEWLFYLRLARSGRAGFVDESLALHHFTRNSLTRTDRLRNLVRQCELFCAMKRELPGLAPHQDDILNAHLSKAYAQLASQYRATGHPGKALTATAKSFFHGRKQKLGPDSVHGGPVPIAASRAAREQVTDQVDCLPAR